MIWIIVTYLLIGLVAMKVFAKGAEVDDEDFKDSALWVVLGSLLLIWPLWLGGFVVYGIGQGMKHFILWDVTAWKARRRTKKIEEDLAKEDA